MATEQAEKKQSSSFSPIWWVPLIAALLGVWMVVDHWRSQGPQITLTFATAEGLEAGKTMIKTRNVDVGVVEAVHLTADLQRVEVVARLNKEVQSLLRDDSRFWVVRPRIGKGGISGLGTLLSGAYIELSPGQSDQPRRAFTGLEDIPLTAAGTPGIALTLFSDGNNALDVSDPVLYRGFRVGQVESVRFDPQLRRAFYQVFIHAPYDQLITTNTVFWNVGGVQLNAGVDGVQLSTGSLESLLGGGVTFDIAADNSLQTARPIRSLLQQGQQAEMRLYADKQAAFERTYQFYGEYLLLLEDSVRGLKAGAPVEYRGIRLGSVAKVAVENLERDGRSEVERRIPVLIHLEPGRIGYGDSEAELARFKQDFSSWLDAGMNARLNTGNIITGQLFVELNFHGDVNEQQLRQYSGYDVVPSSQDGFGQITAKVENLLDKLQQLPVKPLVESADITLQEAQKTLRQATEFTQVSKQLLANEQVQQLPLRINQTLQSLEQSLQALAPESEGYRQTQRMLQQLEGSLQQLQPLLRQLNTRPSSVIFSDYPPADTVPQAADSNER